MSLPALLNLWPSGKIILWFIEQALCITPASSLKFAYGTQKGQIIRFTGSLSIVTALSFLLCFYIC